MRTLLTVLCGSLLTVFLLPSSASAAEVFKCTDSKGRAVFSESPCPDSAVKGQALPQQMFRTMRDLVKEGQKINAELKGDVESLKSCNRAVGELRKKIDAIKSDVDAVALEHRYLYAAYDQLQECAQCRVSAITYCKKADSYLDKSMNELIGKRKPTM